MGFLGRSETAKFRIKILKIKGKPAVSIVNSPKLPM